MVTSDNNTREHLEDSILLAYLRRQQLEDRLRLRISRHIDVEQCPRCRHKLSELAQVSATLNVLGHMPPYQRYPELSVADTFARVQRAANKRTPLQAYLHRISTRQRPRKSVVRLISLPAAIALTILFTVVIVFANLSGVSWISGPFKGGTSSSQNISTAVAPHQSTPTPDLALTATANAGTSMTPTASPVTGPYIEVCSTPADVAQLRLVICGHNFEAGHKVTLVATSPEWVSIQQRVALVDKQGTFQVWWYVYNCRNLPTTIFAYEIGNGNAKPISTKLQNISFAGCPLPTPTVGPSGDKP